MKVAIVGFGLEGQSSFRYFERQGHEITIVDEESNLSLPAGVKSITGENALSNLNDFDLIVRTAGMHPDQILSNNPSLGSRITTQLNEFLKVTKTKNIIGVTGTKGKGTTSTLIAKILEAANKPTLIGGNIGIPMLDLIDKIQEDTFVVLELSSFQLYDLKEKSPHIAVCLMVVPEHLNWHVNLEDYLNAKSQLFSHQDPDDIAIYFKNNEFSSRITGASPGNKIPYFSRPGAIINEGFIKIDDQIIANINEVKLLGKHNLQNVCAAVTTAWQVTKDISAIRSVVTSFSGLEHRLELVKEVDGVKYYDDSFGTTPETAIVAIEAFSSPKILIAGGSDKGADYMPLAEAIVKNNVKQTICIGETGHRIMDLIRSIDPDANVTLLDNSSSTPMADIIKEAKLNTEAGDIVLLSTGSASFGMFKSYKDRGEQFKLAINSL